MVIRSSTGREAVKYAYLKDSAGSLNSLILADESSGGIAVGDRVSVTDYYSDRAGGGGSYTVTAGLGTDDGGSIVNLSGLHLVADIVGTVDPARFGARDDGTVQDVAIQAAIEYAPTGGTVDGKGRTYTVGMLFPKSNSTFKNFNLFHAAGNAPDITPVTIGNDLRIGNTGTVPGGPFPETAVSEARRLESMTAPGMVNITIDNVHVDGNRANQTNVDPEVTPMIPRDGGRHGIVLKGFNTNIRILNSSANYCATDGLLIYHGLHVGGVFSNDVLCARNLRVENCDFSWNRRHGAAGDSLERAWFTDCTFNDNGQTINGGAAGDSGSNGSTSIGNEYGNGFDLEGYGPGSRNEGVRFIGCDMLRNVRSGILIFDVTDQDVLPFTPRRQISLSNCHLDSGTNNMNGQYCVVITSSIANKTKAPMFEGLIIESCHLDGAVLARSVSDLKISDCVWRAGAAGHPFRLLLDQGTAKLSGNTSDLTLVSFDLSNTSYTADDEGLSTSVTWDPGTVPAGGNSSISFTMPGAQVGSVVSAAHLSTFAGQNAEMVLGGAVTTTDTVDVYMYNPTADDRVISAGTLQVRVEPYDGFNGTAVTATPGALGSYSNTYTTPTAFTGDGTTTVFGPVNHALNTAIPRPTVYVDGQVITTGWVANLTDDDNLTIEFGTAPANLESIAVRVDA